MKLHAESEVQNGNSQNTGAEHQEHKQSDSARRLFAMASCAQTGILNVNLIRLKASREKTPEVGEELGSSVASNTQLQLFHMFIDEVSKVKTTPKFKQLVSLRTA